MTAVGVAAMLEEGDKVEEMAQGDFFGMCGGAAVLACNARALATARKPNQSVRTRVRVSCGLVIVACEFRPTTDTDDTWGAARQATWSWCPLPSGEVRLGRRFFACFCRERQGARWHGGRVMVACLLARARVLSRVGVRAER